MSEMTNQQYLEEILSSKKMKLDELHTQHRINISVFNKILKTLTDDIDSIERQLSNNDDQ